MAYNVYSLPDCKSVLYHPDVGTANLHQCGMGKIVVSAAGDLTSHTTTADGYIVVNKLKTTNGTITLEVPQNSIGTTFCGAGHAGPGRPLPRTGSPLAPLRSMTPSPASPSSVPASACKKCRTGLSTGPAPT